MFNKVQKMLLSVLGQPLNSDLKKRTLLLFWLLINFISGAWARVHESRLIKAAGLCNCKAYAGQAVKQLGLNESTVNPQLHGQGAIRVSPNFLTAAAEKKKIRKTKPNFQGCWWKFSEYLLDLRST